MASRLAVADDAARIPAELLVDPDNAALLLRTLAAGPNPEAAKVFERIFLPLAVWYARHRARAAARRALRRTHDVDIFIPGVPEADLDDVAHEAAQVGLRRARERAGRFDPRRGHAVAWVLGKVALAYRDVVRSRYRRGALEFPPDEDLSWLTDVEPYSGFPPAEVVADLEFVLARLPPIERNVLVRYERYGMTYEEIAVDMFGSVGQKKRVDHILQRARERIREILNEHTERQRRV